MKPQQLFLASGKSAGVWYCESCHLVKRTEKEAEECCQPRHCDTCGCEVDRFRITCGDCQRQNVLQRDLDALEKAELVKEWVGWVWHPEMSGHQDGYFRDAEELLDQCDLEDEDVPEYAFCCKMRQLKVHIEDILQRLDDNGWEEMTEHAEGVEELQAAIDKFNELNKETFVIWEADYKRKVRL